ncbi:MAG: flagellar assembly protein FliX [Terricaulis sp.]
MKIESGRGIAPTSSTRRAGGAAAPGFAPAADGAPRAASVAPTAAPQALDAILALQAEDFDSQRRARQARRGKAALDTLEKLEHALVLGVRPAELRAELEAAGRAGEPTGETELDALLLEIDTRLAVELAKLDMAAGGA